MGREARRVPLDFDWPLGEVWKGYLMPDDLREAECSDCAGHGVTAARSWVSQIAALALLLNADLSAQAQGRPMHPYFNDTGSRADQRPSPDIAEFCIGLAGRGEPGRWHDSIDNWRATDALIKAAGLDPETWGRCTSCDGHGTTEAYPGQRAAAEAWEPTGPPVGDGWQMWETTSEGSPKTPVFKTVEELARHCADTGASFFGYEPASYDRWLAVLKDGDIAAVTIAPGVVMM